MSAFNLNDSVWVRLNDRGREIHRSVWTDTMRGVKNWAYRPPVEVDGWSRWQLWVLMQDFGPSISLGTNPPFETEIRLSDPHAKPAGQQMLDGPEASGSDDPKRS